MDYKKLYELEKEKNKKLEEKIIKLENKLKEKKGSKCSISGNKYEKEVYNIVNKCKINNELFNNQKEQELAGSSNKNDIICNFMKKI